MSFLSIATTTTTTHTLKHMFCFALSILLNILNKIYYIGEDLKLEN